MRAARAVPCRHRATDTVTRVSRPPAFAWLSVEPDEDEPRIHDSPYQHRDQRRDEEVEPVPVVEDQDHCGYDQQ
jgi:hypothetical protein